jgi:hypothetical protein
MASRDTFFQTSISLKELSLRVLVSGAILFWFFFSILKFDYNIQVVTRRIKIYSSKRLWNCLKRGMTLVNFFSENDHSPRPFSSMIQNFVPSLLKSTVWTSPYYPGLLKL